MPRKALAFALLALAAAILYATVLREPLSLASLQAREAEFEALYAARPAATTALFFVIYVAMTAASFPGATVMSLLAGALFGVVKGTLVVSFASTIGATAAFLLARYFLRDFVEQRFAATVRRVNEGLAREGDVSLFFLRLVPVVPFFAINLAMGLTRMPTWRFLWVSQLGMLLGTAVYVNAGRELAHIRSLRDVLSPSLVLSFTLAGVLPWLARHAIRRWRARRGTSPEA